MSIKIVSILNYCLDMSTNVASLHRLNRLFVVLFESWRWLQQCCHALPYGLSLVHSVAGPRAEITVSLVTSVSPLLPVASCHIYAGQYGGGTRRGVIASGDKQELMSQLKTEATAYIHLFVLRTYLPRAERQIVFIFRVFRHFLSLEKCPCCSSLANRLAG